MKNKKIILAIVLILFVSIIGLTIAYYTNTISIENEFGVKTYKTTVGEEFISPDNWLPGDTTSKIVVATNNGEIDQAIRIYYEEKWIDSHGEELPLIQRINDENIVVSIIHFDNRDDWYKVTENGIDYYYYKHKLKKGENTNSFISGVTFNPLTRASSEDNCDETENMPEGVREIVCASTGHGYDNAKYTLTITIESVQYNIYKQVWENAPKID